MCLQCTVNTLAVLDALGRYGVFGIVGTQWDSSDGTTTDARDTDGDPYARNLTLDVVPAEDANGVGNARVHAGYASGTSGGPPLAGLSAYVNNVKNHPALLGYYLFDVCQALQSHYLDPLIPACPLLLYATATV